MLSDRPETWQQIYRTNKRFQHICTQCLQLNGVDPDWLTFDQLEALLFQRIDADTGEIRAGWLLELNRPPEAEGSSKGKGEALSAEEMVAAIALTTGNLKEALELYTSVRPSQFVSELLKAQAELKDPDSRTKRKRRKIAKRVKEEHSPEELKRLLAMPIEELKEIGP